MKKKIKSFLQEEWVPFALEYPTAGKYYFVSNYGRLKSVDKITEAERAIKGSTQSRGHRVVSIRFKGNIQKTYFISKLVAEAFCEKTNPDEENFIIHLDHNLANNQFLNLKWVNREGLNDYFQKKGIWDPLKKKRNPAYKMTPSKVKMLKKMLRDGKTKKKIIARKFHITPEQLRKIEKGIDWAWVEIDEPNASKKNAKNEVK